MKNWNVCFEARHCCTNVLHAKGSFSCFSSKCKTKANLWEDGQSFPIRCYLFIFAYREVDPAIIKRCGEKKIICHFILEKVVDLVMVHCY